MREDPKASQGLHSNIGSSARVDVGGRLMGVDQNRRQRGSTESTLAIAHVVMVDLVDQDRRWPPSTGVNRVDVDQIDGVNVDSFESV